MTEKKTIGVNMNLTMATELESRAFGMGISTGAFIKVILADWLSSNKKLSVSEGQHDK
jgi:hypothetical protein